MSKQLGVQRQGLTPIPKSNQMRTRESRSVSQPSMQTMARPQGHSKQLDVPIHDDDFIGGIRGFRTTVSDRKHSSHRELSRGAQAESRLGMIQSHDGQQFDAHEFI